MIQQYVVEAGQAFEPEVIRRFMKIPLVQPGLVNGLCALLVTVATDRHYARHHRPHTAPYRSFCRERFNKNISNVVQKALEKRELILRLLFLNVAIPFTVHDPDIGYLYAHGVVASRDGYVDIPVPRSIASAD
ncbi:MAG: hypothetical protein R3E79_35200 [Caldilineaceae bacterium]